MEVRRVSDVIEYARLLGILAGALAFMILLAVDIRHAFRKKDFWVPGRTLVLSVLTLQIMGFIESQSDVVNEMLDSVEISPEYFEYVKNCLFMIHTSRVMLCLLVALFLPEMASPDNQEKWTKIAALGITIFADIFTQVYGVNNRFSKSAVNVIYKWFFISGTIISITLLWLIVLLICSATASKSIREITTQKIPIILAEPAENSWKGVEDQVLKSLIVGRPFYLETIILNPPAAMGVTVCIISSLVGWVVVGPKVKIFPSTAVRLVFIISILQVIFILIGWAVVSWRLLISIAFYGRRRTDIRHFFLIEDFWTRQIFQLQGAEELKLTKLKYDESVIRMFVTKLRNPRVDDRLSKMIVKEKKKRKGLVWILLHCLILLQRYVVFFSKVCWFFSYLIFRNRIIRKIVSLIFSKQRLEIEKELEQYTAIWDSIESIWGQSPYTLFVTNRKAIKQAKSIMNKGNESGENCHTLISFLTNRMSEICINIWDLDPDKQAEKYFKFLWRRYPVPLLEGQKYFKYARNRSWKLTAVSFISIIIMLSPRRGRDSLQAYNEAWELIDLVEESDPATDSLLSKAADRLFTSVRDESEDVAPTTMEKARDQSENAAPTTMEEARDQSENVAPSTMEKARDQSENAAPTTMEEAAEAIDYLAKKKFT